MRIDRNNDNTATNNNMIYHNNDHDDNDHNTGHATYNNNDCKLGQWGAGAPGGTTTCRDLRESWVYPRME